MSERNRLLNYDEAKRVVELRFAPLISVLEEISQFGCGMLLERGKDGFLVRPNPDKDRYYTDVYFVGALRQALLMLEGVISLLNRGLTHPARVVTRTLFELLVTAKYIDKTSQEPLARQLLYSSLRDQERSWEEAVRALESGGGSPEAVTTMKEQLERVRRDKAKVSFPKVQDRPITRWPGRAFADMAKDVDLGMEYVAHYKDLSWDAHGTLSVFHITRRLKAGGLAMRDMFDLQDTRMIATLTGNWALELLEVIAKRWGAQVRPLDRVRQRLATELASVVWPGSPLTEPRLPSSGALVLGVDVGFSASRKTCCAYVLRVDPLANTIELAAPSVRFALPSARASLAHLFAQSGKPAVVSIDAPLTPSRLAARPATGRAVDKWFARGPFSAAKAGPQVTSIAVPKQGWPLYSAGMDLVGVIRGLDQTLEYLPFERLSLSARGIVECIPKLFHALLVDPSVVRKRKGLVDDFLFPLLFAGELRFCVDELLGSFRFGEQLEKELRRVATRPSRFHEEIGGLVAAIQGALFVLGRCSAVGCSGEYEGYFLLPPVALWHKEWAEAGRGLEEEGSRVRLLFTPWHGMA